jgi:general secretion pathway protein E
MTANRAVVETAFMKPNAPLLDLTYAFVKANGVMLRHESENRIVVALREGADPLMLLEVRRYLAMPCDVEFASKATFERYMSEHYLVHEAAADTHIPIGDNDSELMDGEENVAVIRLIGGILSEAEWQGVSDIHFEPNGTKLSIRMRTDGILHEYLNLPASIGADVVACIKTLAQLDSTECHVPQDGNAEMSVNGKTVNISVATLPSRTGERITMGIVSKKIAAIPLDLLELSDQTRGILSRALAQPHGIILITGPVGSGITTTLYACLKSLNDGTRNILTAEYPIAYAIDGIGQTQIESGTGQSFAAGLKTILRQDPDVVMVGEILDRETADAAVQAAQDGHLVLTAVQANDAIGAITQLRALKVEPFLLASTLRAVIAQRQMRRLCQTCRQTVQADGNAASLLGFDKGTAVFAAVGCSECNYTGYQGRIGVFEAICVDDTIRRLINDGGDAAILARHAFINQPNINAAARKLVRAGHTTPQEAIRISRCEDIDNED